MTTQSPLDYELPSDLLCNTTSAYFGLIGSETVSSGTCCADIERRRQLTADALLDGLGG